MTFTFLFSQAASNIYNNQLYVQQDLSFTVTSFGRPLLQEQSTWVVTSLWREKLFGKVRGLKRFYRNNLLRFDSQNWTKYWWCGWHLVGHWILWWALWCSRLHGGCWEGVEAEDRFTHVRFTVKLALVSRQVGLEREGRRTQPTDVALPFNTWREIGVKRRQTGVGKLARRLGPVWIIPMVHGLPSLRRFLGFFFARQGWQLPKGLSRHLAFQWRERERWTKQRRCPGKRWDPARETRGWERQIHLRSH